MIFWDTSAVVPLIVRESESERATSVLGDDPGMVTWWGTSLECLAALARREREGSFTDAEADSARQALGVLAASWHEITPADLVRDHAARLLLRHPLRGADSLQLGAALVWARERPAGHRFFTLDERLAQAARREGFALVAPLSGPSAPQAR